MKATRHLLLLPLYIFVVFISLAHTERSLDLKSRDLIQVEKLDSCLNFKLLIFFHIIE